MTVLNLLTSTVGNAVGWATACLPKGLLYREKTLEYFAVENNVATSDWLNPGGKNSGAAAERFDDLTRESMSLRS